MQQGTTSLTSTYPDVLALFSGEARLTIDVVQCALAVYPQGAAVGQPFEALLLLQNTCDQSVQVKAAVQLPRRTGNGERISLFAPRELVDVTLAPAEVGLLHFPLVPQVPTPVGTDYPLDLRIAVNRPRNAKLIRDVFGGRMPGVLPISKHRR